MSKAVLISIRSKWVEKIANGEKTIEVRKTRPKLKTPFKAYIYCTTSDAKNPRQILEFHGADGKIHKANGKVIGEFICTKLDWITRVGVSGCYIPSRYSICDPKNMSVLPIDDLLHAARLSYMELADYLAGGNGYGWHISGLLIYDEPRELGKFTGLRNTRFGAEPVEIKRPPQSWCYVEEM